MKLYSKSSLSVAAMGILLGLALGLTGCSSKKKNSDADAPAEAGATVNTAPAVDSTPMSFDATGSDSGNIEGLYTIHFAFDKATLTPETKHQIQKNVEWMKAHSGVSLQVEGHCDAKGSIEYNLALGERRAQAVKSYMVSLGANEGKLNVISYGKEKPVAKGDTEADYSKNRRANFLPLAN